MNFTVSLLIKADTLAGVRGCGSIELLVESGLVFANADKSPRVALQNGDFNPAMAGADTAIKPAATKAVEVSRCFFFFSPKELPNGHFYLT